MKYKVLIIVCLSCFFYPAVAQEDMKPSFIVENNNDTLWGKGNVSLNQKFCLFKQKGDKKYRKIHPKEIEAFKIIDGRYYISRQINDDGDDPQWFFLEYLVDGEIDLFALDNRNKYFVKKTNEDFLELSHQNEKMVEVKGQTYKMKDYTYIGYLRAYMSDAPELYSSINKMKRINEKDLIDLSLDYHNAVCNEYDCINYSKKVPTVRHKLQAIAGVSVYGNQHSPLFGVLWNVWRPETVERLYLTTGLLYSQDMMNDTGGKSNYTVKVPISIQYIFSRRALKPTIGFGYGTTGIYPLSSLQGGFVYDLNDKQQLSISGSINGLFESISIGRIFSYNIHLGLSYQLQ